jgi:hypothetical protein
LHPGQLVEARAVEEDFCGGWALARVLQVHRGGSAGIASVDVEYCDFREEGEATNTRERVSFLHTTDDRRWVFPRIRLPRLPTKPTGAWPPALQQEQIVEVFVHDIWWWGEVVRLEEQAGVAGVRFEPPPLGEGDLTSHPLYNLRLSTADPGQGMVTLAAEVQQPAAERGPALASQALPRARSNGGSATQLGQVQAAVKPRAAAAPVAAAAGAALTAQPAVPVGPAAAAASATAADARAKLSAAGGSQAKGGSSLAGSSAAQQQQAHVPSQQVPGRAQQPQQPQQQQQAGPWLPGRQWNEWDGGRCIAVANAT